jgi:hypothetical protein
MGTIGKCCNGGCCCCGAGEMPDLPDYYCRFFVDLPPGIPSQCVDTVRQELNWQITEFNLDNSILSVDLKADYAGGLGSPTFDNDDDISCCMEYKDLFPYGYSFAYTNDTEWVIIEESQCSGTKFFTEIGNRDYCMRFQTQARVKYGLQNLKVNIARCKIPNEACDDEVGDMEEKECGYLVTATMDVLYAITTYQWASELSRAPAGSGTACDGVQDYLALLDPSYDPIASGLAGNPIVTYYSKCITRSQVVKTLKNNPLDPTQIYVDFDSPIAGQDVECCKDWPSPTRKFFGGKDENYNDETFRCSCDSELALVVEGDCDDNRCVIDDPGAAQVCNAWSISIPFMAGKKWILSW